MYTALLHTLLPLSPTLAVLYRRKLDWRSVERTNSPPTDSTQHGSFVCRKSLSLTFDHAALDFSNGGRARNRKLCGVLLASRLEGPEPKGIDQ